MLRAFAALLAAALATAACGSTASSPTALVRPSGGQGSPLPGGSVRTFEITAKPTTVHLDQRTSTQAWTYNGTVPGPELRVRQGDLVRVTLHNQLPGGTTIHWHGVTLPNGEDGVAGVTQDPTPPGGTATYDFIATTPGTYWYHPHQHSAEQEDKGLYGALIVAPTAPTAPPPAVDKTLVVDEWPLGPQQMPPPAEDDPGMAMYGVYSVNGRTGSQVEPVRVTPGALVRLRLVNAGFLTHQLHVHGAAVRIVATDGHDLAGGAETTAPLPLAAAERLDIEFAAPAGLWSLHAHDGTAPAAGLRVPILAPDAPLPDALPDTDWKANQAALDLASYSSSALVSRPSASGAENFTLRLNESASGGGGGHGGMSGMSGMGNTAMGGLTYTINGKAFPDTENLQVNRGDTVTLTFVNQGKFAHPMHLHGHAFTPLSMNGQPWASEMLKDTVSVPPSATVVVRFTADNPGVWMIHCHELHHAAGGMDTLLVYQGAPRLANLSGPGQPAPE